MSKIIDIGVEKDHIESLTKASGINSLAELLWNSLDADATEINVDFKQTALGGYEYIKVTDNGHGLTYEKAQDIFSRIGGSEKKLKPKVQMADNITEKKVKEDTKVYPLETL